jgi:hypothetical protein
MQAAPDMSESVHLRRERDLYLRILTLGTQTELEPFLREALALMVEVAGAHQGYLELHPDDDPADSPRWWIAHGFSSEEVDAVRATISQGIVAHALATGRTVVTPSALLDPRFRDRGSVRSGRIEAVLCAPIGEDPPSRPGHSPTRTARASSSWHAIWLPWSIACLPNTGHGRTTIPPAPCASVSSSTASSAGARRWRRCSSRWRWWRRSR